MKAHIAQFLVVKISESGHERASQCLATDLEGVAGVNTVVRYISEDKASSAVAVNVRTGSLVAVQELIKALLKRSDCETSPGEDKTSTLPLGHMNF